MKMSRDESFADEEEEISNVLNNNQERMHPGLSVQGNVLGRRMVGLRAGAEAAELGR